MSALLNPYPNHRTLPRPQSPTRGCTDNTNRSSTPRKGAVSYSPHRAPTQQRNVSDQRPLTCLHNPSKTTTGAANARPSRHHSPRAERGPALRGPENRKLWRFPSATPRAQNARRAGILGIMNTPTGLGRRGLVTGAGVLVFKRRDTPAPASRHPPTLPLLPPWQPPVKRAREFARGDDGSPRQQR